MIRCSTSLAAWIRQRRIKQQRNCWKVEADIYHEEYRILDVTHRTMDICIYFNGLSVVEEVVTGLFPPEVETASLGDHDAYTPLPYRPTKRHRRKHFI